VQTPVLGAAADGLSVGDRVWLRHAKGGELAERLTTYHLIDPVYGSADGLVDSSVDSVPTYRGEGQCFG
jgi:D-serine deaminase-like pyridoxal phosphate-dependent protein